MNPSNLNALQWQIPKGPLKPCYPYSFPTPPSEIGYIRRLNSIRICTHEFFFEIDQRFLNKKAFSV